MVLVIVWCGGLFECVCSYDLLFVWIVLLFQVSRTKFGGWAGEASSGPRPKIIISVPAVAKSSSKLSLVINVCNFT